MSSGFAGLRLMVAMRPSTLEIEGLRGVVFVEDLAAAWIRIGVGEVGIAPLRQGTDI